MSENGVQIAHTDASLEKILATVPLGELDTPEVEGGLTWRQTAILALTHGHLRIPGDETATPPFDARLAVRRSVDQALRTHCAENGALKSAKEAVVFCLTAAVDEYTKVCATTPEWETDKSLIEDLLDLWRAEDIPYITETLASNVLYCMYNPLSGTQLSKTN